MIQVAQDIAWGPAKSLPMQAIMMYMTGSSVSIISIMIVGMCLVNSVKALGAVHQRKFFHDHLQCASALSLTIWLTSYACFAGFERVADGSVDLLVPKLVYVGVNAAFLALGLWKCGKLGLLPTTSADWTSYLVRSDQVESSGVTTIFFD